MNILVPNAGSSSQKIRLYELAGDALPSSTPPAPLWAADWGSKSGSMTVNWTARAETRNTEESAREWEEILTHFSRLTGLEICQTSSDLPTLTLSASASLRNDEEVIRQ